MKHQLAICTTVLTTALTMVLATLSPVPAAAQQMAVSHAPTVAAKPQPANLTISVSNRPVARVNGTVLTDRDLVREM